MGEEAVEYKHNIYLEFKVQADIQNDGEHTRADAQR